MDAVPELKRILLDANQTGENQCGCESSVACRAALEALAESDRLDGASRTYDLRRICDTWLNRIPDESWPTAALMMTARQGILSHPWVRGLYRSTTITQSLALLGERGLPPDAYVRLYLARTFARRVLIEAAGAFVYAREPGIDPSGFPYQVADWFPKLQALDSHDAPFNVLLSEACGGPLMQDVEAWIERAAVAHLIDWRIDNFLEVEIDARDRVLAGGREATFWVFDRFSFTSTEEWYRGSADWEAAYAYDPAAVSAFVGVHRSLLEERPTSQEMALSAQTRRLVSSEAQDEAGRGLFLTDMVEQILARIQTGDLAEALAEAKRAHEIAPQLWITANALAFCLVPSSPTDALSILKCLNSTTEQEARIGTANMIAAHIAAREWIDAEAGLSTLTDVEDEHAYLWTASSLTTGSPDISYIRFDRWIDETRQVITSGTLP